MSKYAIAALVALAMVCVTVLVAMGKLEVAPIPPSFWERLAAWATGGALGYLIPSPLLTPQRAADVIKASMRPPSN